MEFTEEEVKQKLYELGYKDVPRSKLLEFMNGMKFCWLILMYGTSPGLNLDKNCALLLNPMPSHEIFQKIYFI